MFLEKILRIISTKQNRKKLYIIFKRNHELNILSAIFLKEVLPKTYKVLTFFDTYLLRIILVRGTGFEPTESYEYSL